MAIVSIYFVHIICAKCICVLVLSSVLCKLNTRKLRSIFYWYFQYVHSFRVIFDISDFYYLQYILISTKTYALYQTVTVRNKYYHQQTGSPIKKKGIQKQNNKLATSLFKSRSFPPYHHLTHVAMQQNWSNVFSSNRDLPHCYWYEVHDL